MLKPGKCVIQLFVLCLLIVSLDCRPVVQLPNGRIKGIVMKSFSNRSINAYMSIPYAKPPVGQLRFKEAEEADPWRGTLDAGQAPEACMQIPFASDALTGVEDCLYINVFTPIPPLGSSSDERNERLLPVIAYIHGGAYYFLSSSRYGPRYLLDHDVILVSFNYRLGTLGFLSSGDEVMPGNLGMKDQVLALKWIQKNVQYFGGDPKLVTLFGMSAGAASVHLHYTSPLSKDLFNSSIIIGGSAFFPWAIQTYPRTKFKKIAENVSCYGDISESLVNCLRNVSAEKLVRSMFLLQSKYIKVPVAPLAPVIEAAGERAFLLDDPFQSFSRGNVHTAPAIFTFTDSEGTFPVARFIANPSLLDQINKFWISFCVELMELVDKVNMKVLNEMCYKIRKFYCGNSVISLANINCLLKLTTDRYMTNVVRGITAMSRTSSNVYAYLLSYKGSYSISISLGNTHENYGAGHIDDLFYYLNTSVSQVYLESNSEDIKMMKILTSMVVKFALTRKAEWPNQDWKPVEKVKSSDLFLGKLNFLRIFSPSSAKMIQAENWANSSFWNSLPICEPWAGRFPSNDSPSVLSKCYSLLYGSN